MKQHILPALKITLAVLLFFSVRIHFYHLGASTIGAEQRIG